LLFARQAVILGLRRSLAKAQPRPAAMPQAIYPSEQPVVRLLGAQNGTLEQLNRLAYLLLLEASRALTYCKNT